MFALARKMSNMASVDPSSLVFENQTVSAQFIDPSGNIAAHQIEIRTHPITGRTCRISFSRIEEKEPATGSMPLGLPRTPVAAGVPEPPTQAEGFLERTERHHGRDLVKSPEHIVR